MLIKTLGLACPFDDAQQLVALRLLAASIAASGLCGAALYERFRHDSVVHAMLPANGVELHAELPSNASAAIREAELARRVYWRTSADASQPRPATPPSLAAPGEESPLAAVLTSDALEECAAIGAKYPVPDVASGEPPFPHVFLSTRPARLWDGSLVPVKDTCQLLLFVTHIAPRVHVRMASAFQIPMEPGDCNFFVVFNAPKKMTKLKGLKLEEELGLSKDFFMDVFYYKVRRGVQGFWGLGSFDARAISFACEIAGRPEYLLASSSWSAASPYMREE
jgi:hypothetical protein